MRSTSAMTRSVPAGVVIAAVTTGSSVSSADRAIAISAAAHIEKNIRYQRININVETSLPIVRKKRISCHGLTAMAGRRFT